VADDWAWPPWHGARGSATIKGFATGKAVYQWRVAYVNICLVGNARIGSIFALNA